MEEDENELKETETVLDEYYKCPRVFQYFAHMLDSHTGCGVY